MVQRTTSRNLPCCEMGAGYFSIPFASPRVNISTIEDVLFGKHKRLHYYSIVAKASIIRLKANDEENIR
eukprot:scaffold2533_cov137-Cylindrotheca_fusiformis.AAC.5